jgi:iron(III) transport system ATP-binding protein
MASIRTRELTKRFGDTIALDRVSLAIEPGELYFLLGPSGCGKTTLLRVLAGFAEPNSGDIFFAEKCVTHSPPRSRDAGMVFQSYALWPHLTVAENIAYGLRIRKWRRREIDKRVAGMLKLVRMEQHGRRFPAQLSGGQQQRVALARALVVEPQVLLLDEPLSNLDARLREEMRVEIGRIHKETGVTTVYVTHDQTEALALADRIGVMDRGQVIQVDAPEELYNRPANQFVASFLGDSNFLPGRVSEANGALCTVETPVGPLVGHAASGNGPKLSVGSDVVCSIRPQALSLREELQERSTVNPIEARVIAIEFLGQLIQVRLVSGDTQLLMTTLPRIAGKLKPGDAVTIAAEPDHVIFL